MAIEKDEVIKVATLARLAITEDKIDEYTHNLSNILGMVEQMNQADTDGVEPLSNPLDATQRLRVDEVTAEIDRDLFQSVAPSTENGLYLVPRVIE